jgi:hypothetical protein
VVIFAGDGSAGCLDSAPFEIGATVDVPGPEIESALKIRMRGGRVYLEGSVPAGPVGEASLEIFDVLGRRLANPWRGRAGESFMVPAPTTDADGRRLSSGIYFARLRLGGQTWLARFALLSGR